MAYLHENRDEFLTAVSLCVEKFGILPEIVEKDYYVTFILRLIAGIRPFIVFKGGTSLSKCHKVIKRFSEDIDLTVDQEISRGQKKKIKEALRDIAAELGMNIPNIDQTQSKNSYNKYIFEYNSVLQKTDSAVKPSLVLETSYAEISFPTIILPIDCYVGKLMEKEAPEEIGNFSLDPFEMKVQSIDRTMADKIFALCDYYMKGNVSRHSRHIYDICKLLPLVPLNDAFARLVHEVRSVRAKNVTLCLSAQPGVNISEKLMEIVDNNIYQTDYESVTSRILEEHIPYETAIKAVSEIAGSGIFD